MTTGPAIVPVGLSVSRRAWRLFFWIWLLLAVPAALWAAGGTAPAAGLLFELRHGEAPPSYLLGTMHSEDPRVLGVLEQVQPSLTGSRRLILEMVPDGPAMLAASLGMLLGDGQTLAELLPAELYAEVKAAAAEAALPEQAIRRLRPWAVAVMLALPEAGGGAFMDARLYHQALESGLPVSGLETPMEQLAVFDDMSPRLQQAFLRDAVRNRAQVEVQYERMVNAYLSRDLEALRQFAETDSESLDPEVARWFDRQVLQSRNRRMFERLLQEFDRGQAFVAVGALHLAGEQGLLALLGRAGFSIRAVY